MIYRKKLLLPILLSLASLASLYFSFVSLSSLFDFFHLKSQAPATIVKWEIKERQGKFPIYAHYFFETEGKVWTGVTVLSKPWHLNELAASQNIQKLAKQNFNVWFYPKNPKKSSLEKTFPTNLLIRTGICYSTIIYFLIVFRKYLILYFR